MPRPGVLLRVVCPVYPAVALRKAASSRGHDPLPQAPLQCDESLSPPDLARVRGHSAAKGVLPFPEASYLILTSVLFLAPCTNFLRHFWPPQLKALT